MKETDAYARGSDPSTAHEAAERVSYSKLEGKVYNALYPFWPRYLTVIEIAKAMAIDKWSVSPRMAPLERKGYVEHIVLPSLNSADNIRNLQAWRVVRKRPVQMVLPLPPVTHSGGMFAAVENDQTQK